MVVDYFQDLVVFDSLNGLLKFIVVNKDYMDVCVVEKITFTNDSNYLVVIVNKRKPSAWA